MLFASTTRSPRFDPHRNKTHAFSRHPDADNPVAESVRHRWQPVPRTVMLLLLLGLAPSGWAANLYFMTPGVPMLGTVNPATGAVIDQFTPNTAKNFNGRGIAVVGNIMYYTVADNANVYAANRITHADLGFQFTTASIQGVANIVYDGANFWISEYTTGSNRLFYYSLTGTLLKTITLSNCAGNCDGLAYFKDPVTGAGRLISNRNDAGGVTGNTIYDIYDTNGTLVTAAFLSTKTNAGGGTTGITWDGTNFWVAEGFADIPGKFLKYSSTGTFIQKVSITGTNAPGVFEAITADFPVTPPAPLQLVPVTPCRIMDTRLANGTFGGPFIGGGSTRTIPIPSSSCSIPANAAAYSLNVTVVPKVGFLGYLTVWPTGQTQPFVSTLNSPDGSILANAAIVPAGASGSIDVFALQDTHLVIDINGYFITQGAGTLQFFPLTPCRVLDTRNANGTFGGPSITGGASRTFAIQTSPCGAPAAAKAYSFNVTVVPPGFFGFLTAWPTGQTQPFVSTLNSLDGTTLANAAIVPAGTPNGSVSFFANNTTDLVVDINGYFAPPATGGLNFYTIPPCRVADTRNATGTFGGPILNAGSTRTFPIPTSTCGLPSTAGAYSLNMTVQPTGFLGFLTTWPTGAAQPNVSTLNDAKGIVTANGAIVPAGTSGSTNVFVLNTTHVIIDANGYFAP